MIFKKCCYRIYQYVLTSVMHIIKYGNKVISKEGAVYNIPQLLERQGIKGRVLIITGPHIAINGTFPIVSIFQSIFPTKR